MKELPCNVIHDLMPSYVDGICSKESKELVENHLRSCQECQSYRKRMSSDGDDFTWKDKKEIDGLKKLRAVIGLKSLILMAVIILTSAAFSYYTLNCHNTPTTFFLLTPLVLICNYLMFSNTYTNSEKEKEKAPVILGAIELCSLAWVFLLMRVFLSKCIVNMDAGRSLPFHLDPLEIGPLIATHIKTVILINIIIWCILNYLHIKGRKFYMIVSCFAIAIVYTILFYIYILKYMDSPSYYTTMSNQVLLLLGENIIVIALLKILDVIRGKRERDILLP